MKIADILNAVALGIEATDTAIEDPKASAVAKGAAAVVRLVAALTEGRTPEQAIAILEHIRDHGTLPISSTELDAQVKAAMDKVQGG